MLSCIMVPGVLGSTCGTYKIYQAAVPYTPVTMMKLHVLAINLSLAIDAYKHHLTLEIGLMLAESKDTGEVGKFIGMGSHVSSSCCGWL